MNWHPEYIWEGRKHSEVQSMDSGVRLSKLKFWLGIISCISLSNKKPHFTFIFKTEMIMLLMKLFLGLNNKTFGTVTRTQQGADKA